MDFTAPARTANWSYAPTHWIDRADEEGWGYLMARTPPSPLICRSRGKLLLMAAGQHAMVICFALETSIIGMSVNNYRRILSADYPGPNFDGSKAEHLWTFHIPNDLVVANSSPSKPRTMKIVAAFVSDSWVWTINDWTSLVRLYVLSSDVHWTPDLVSKHWDTLFDRFNGGPDWVLEKHLAMSRLAEWRNDLLHLLCWFPGTPSYVICSDDKLFNELADGIYQYLYQFTLRSFLDIASSVPNSDNPLTFNEYCNTVYLRKWVLVYRRSMAQLTLDLYNDYVSKGLMDDGHTVGLPYKAPSGQLLGSNRRHQSTPVYYYDKPLCAFTVIRARPPESWGYVGERVNDIKQFQYKTTIGMSQFRVQLQNRPDYRRAEPGAVINGRPRKVSNINIYFKI
ncbi:hypothetical protein BDZ97DRAFT_1646869 [Flammula alnicola]|nr:hypothetical protein BDZ97DRAFT_1646869 [Flammula alnicola]